MKKVVVLLFVAMMVAVSVPSVTFAGSDQAGQGSQENPQTPPAPEPGTGGSDQGDSGNQGDQSDQAGQTDQGGAQIPGQKAGCSLWQFIKKLFTKDPVKEAEALQKLLKLVNADLDLCLGELSGKRTCYLKVFPAVGHLNHALSALGKAHPPKHLKPAFKELAKRISHTKFYLVAYDFDEAQGRIEAAKDFLGDLN